MQNILEFNSTFLNDTILSNVSQIDTYKSIRRTYASEKIFSDLVPKVNTKFKLGDSISQQQKAFFDHYGFLHFKNVFEKADIQTIKKELKAAHLKLINQQKTQINGVPLKFGYGLDSELLIQRLPFSSNHSLTLQKLVRSEAIQKLLSVFPNSRIGENEKDGVVANHYVNKVGSTFKGMGWHTDSLRDIFYFQQPKPMLNVGIHLDDSPAYFGGLRLVPGTHKQNIWNALFYKPYFINHTPDKNEIAVETEEGDLTIHDGRLWHRAQAPTAGAKGERRVIYFPILTGKLQLKNENSPTPIYLKLMKNIKPFKK
jgi:phytanoyl-CoA hydroxylase